MTRAVLIKIDACSIRHLIDDNNALLKVEAELMTVSSQGFGSPQSTETLVVTAG